MKDPPFLNTPACNAIRLWLATRGNTVDMLARVCAVAKPTARKWAAGWARPAEHLRPALHVLAGILPRFWRTREEERARQSAAQRAARIVRRRARAEVSQASRLAA